MDRGALDDALERRGRHRLGPVDLGHERRKIVIDERDEGLPKLLEIDAAGLHHLGRVGLVDKGQQKVFERRELMPPGVGQRQC